MFLEQGDPYRSSVSNEGRIWWFVGAFLLAGIVISNAYKNENVYNMIAPRKPIPYETFNELFRDNFTIFTRIIDLHIFQSRYAIDAVLRSLDINGVKGKYMYLEHEGFHDAAVSEVATMGRNLISAFYTMYYQPLSINEWLNPKHGHFGLLSLLKQAHVAGDIIENFQSLMNEAIVLLQGNWMEKLSAVVGKLLEKLKNSDTATQYQHLVTCNNVAVLQPKYICQKVARKLKSSGNQTSVFVGVEAYSEIQLSFSLAGIIPSHLPTKIKAAHEAGIWMRWNLLFLNDHTGHGNRPVTAARMDGNVVLIFLLWVIGQGFALCCFVIEACVLVLKLQ